jgi:hypothetical protein
MTEAQVPATVSQDDMLPAELGELAGFTGYENMDPAKFIIPRAKIIQPTSDLGTPGTIIMLLTGEEMSELELMVVKTEPGRTLWEKDNFEAPICRSLDGITPDPRIEEPQCAECASAITKGGRTVYETVCPKAKWGPDGEKPECGEQINALCLALPEGLPFWISLGGTNLKPIQKYISAIGLRSKPLFMYKSEAKVVERTDPKRHYVIDYGKPIELSVADITAYKDILLRIKDESIGSTYDEEERVKAAAEDGDGGEAKPESKAKKPDWMKKGKGKGKKADETDK